MGKKTIDLKKNEQCLIVDKTDTVIIFKELKTKDNIISTGIELVLPDEGILKEDKEYGSVALATAITMKIKTDPNFTGNIMQWFTDYIHTHGQDVH